MFIPGEEYKQILSVLPIVCVDLLIVHDGKCLLLLRNNEPAKGTYWFPGGRIYKMETIEQAALRKAKEETNLECLFEKIISVEESLFEKTGNMFTPLHTVNVCCLMSVPDTAALRIDTLHSQYLWAAKLNKDWHPAVVHPMSLIGFDF